MPVSAGNLVIGGSSTITLGFGGNSVLDSTQVLNIGGSSITVAAVGRTSPVAVFPDGTPTVAPVLTFGGSTIVANPSGAFVLAPGETLQPGSALTVGGTTLSLASAGTIAIVNGATVTLVPNAVAQTPVPVVTVNNQIVTASISGSQTAFVFGPGQTLTAGGIITVSGTTFSLPASTSGIVVINGKTSTLGTVAIAATPTLTINGQTYTPVISNGQTMYVIAAGTTLTPGGVVTVSGTRISLDSSGTALVFGNVTSTIPYIPKSTVAQTTISRSTIPGGSTTASGLGVTHNAGAGRITASLICIAGFLVAIFRILFL